MAVKRNGMRQELDKATLSRLYLQDKKSTYAIAEAKGWSESQVVRQCNKYGIMRRPSRREKIKIDKSILQKLYVEESKSIEAIAAILTCNPTTVLRRLKEYKIPVRDGRIKGLTKRLLQKFYVKEGRSTREIGKLFGCSRYPVQSRCREFGIPLRDPRLPRIVIRDETLQRLYLKEDRSIAEIAKIVGCCYRTIYNRVKRRGLDKEKREGR